MEEMKFEDALKQLKIIVEKLESNELGLDEAITVYEEGIKLSKYCRLKLDTTEKLITTVINENGETSEFIE